MSDHHHSSFCPPQPIAGKPQSGRFESIAFWLMLLYFAAKMCFFALRIRERVFPDEASWFGMVEVFSRSLFLPVDSPESYPFGLITHIPSLYFFLMGKVVVCNILPVSDLIFLRLVNVAISLVTVAFAWRLSRVMMLAPAVCCLFMIMVTNTVMFSVVSAAVSYDSLSTLLAVLSLYYLVLFFQRRLVVHALWGCFFTLIGTLTKIVLLPYGLGLLLAVVFTERRRLLEFVKVVPSLVVSLRGREAVLAGLCFCALAANLALYGGNYIRFGSVMPGMNQVLPVEACLQNRLFVRDYVVREYQSGKLTLLDAQRLALQIRDPGDRASAWNRLAEVVNNKQNGPSPRMGRGRYAMEWVEVVVSRTYSVAAHLSLFKYESDFYPYYAIFLLSAILWLFRGRALLVPGLEAVIIVAIFYSFFLMQGVNYTIYRVSGAMGLALTGRYMFPVL
ncbi:MAG: hypothetical protein Q8J76_07850, partial [Desulfobulbaceae bacterium]|nr:hypothetical protein [Desulfobulbaceae bacterium]